MYLVDFVLLLVHVSQVISSSQYGSQLSQIASSSHIVEVFEKV